MEKCRPTLTPAIKESRKAVLSDERLNQNPFSYRSAVGALLCMATGVRPNISRAVGIVSRNLKNQVMKILSKSCESSYT